MAVSDNNDLESKLLQKEYELSLMQAALDHQGNILIFTIDHQFKYRAFNNAFVVATEYAYGTVVKKEMSLFESITNDADREKIRLNCSRAMNGEHHMTSEVFGSINPLTYETHYHPVVSEFGTNIGVTVISSNVTSRVVAEQQIKTLNKEIDSFTYMAAHDLRVPLRIINGYAKILSEDYQSVLDEEGKRLVGIIGTQVNLMARLIDDLLLFAQLGRSPVNARETSIRDIVQQCIDEQVSLVERNRVEFVIGNLPPCKCDPVLLRSALSHLLANAVKFSSKSEHPRVEVGARRENEAMVYFVKDNGIGFDMKFSSKLFGLFQRLHKPNEFEGTGVGLAIVQRIVGKHGGRVWFDSEPGKGATFYFNLLPV